MAWLLLDDPKLPARARSAIRVAPLVAVSAASLYEVAYNVRRGRWPEMEPYLEGLEGWIAADGVRLVDATADAFLRAGLLDWPRRDPFDRLIAATTQAMGLALVSIDPAFDTLSGGLTRVW